MAKQKKSVGRPNSNRMAPLYTRVSKLNKAFVKEISAHAESEAHFVDTLLTYARNKMTRTALKGLFNGKKAGNKVPNKISKSAQKAA